MELLFPLMLEGLPHNIENVSRGIVVETLIGALLLLTRKKKEKKGHKWGRGRSEEGRSMW